MKFPMTLLNNGCSLCEKIKNRRSDPSYLGTICECHVFRSPFGERWPGSLMLVYERHREELSDIVSNGIPAPQNALLLAEQGIRKVINPNRMNVVKFGNVCPHLHWHLIPRFSGELQPQKTPWELQNLSDEQIFSATALTDIIAIRQENFEKQIFSAVVDANKNPARYFYSAAVVVRPKKNSLRKRYFEAPLSEIIAAVRTNPSEWESLLMRRNYDDYGWDHFGGCADVGEFPKDTLLREVREEAGWGIRDCTEIARHWRGRVLRGFAFIAIPNNLDAYCNDIHPSFSDEVSSAQWFSLPDILHRKDFSETIKKRTQCLLDGSVDFECDDSITLVAIQPNNTEN